MNKYVRITVSTSLSTDFYLEVLEDADEETIKQLAEKEVTLPHNYPAIVDHVLQGRGIRVDGLDSMLRDWNVDELEFIVDDDLS